MNANVMRELRAGVTVYVGDAGKRIIKEERKGERMAEGGRIQ